MTKQGVNYHFQQLCCSWDSIQIWGLIHNNKITHLSFDHKRHEKICSSLEVSTLSVKEQEKLCSFLFTVLQGETVSFPADSPFIQEGTSFQQEVWQSLSRIPFGETRTYGDIAQELGNPQFARAVGSACNKNPLPLIIPCHRVVSATGLGGFAGGSEVKKALLDYEQDFKGR